jgi:hypothetical protein
MIQVPGDQLTDQQQLKIPPALTASIPRYCWYRISMIYGKMNVVDREFPLPDKMVCWQFHTTSKVLMMHDSFSVISCTSSLNS